MYNYIFNIKIYFIKQIIHLDGTQARPPKIAQFNNGNMPYELLIKSNTTISNLGKFEPMEIVYTTPEKIELSDVLNATKNRISEYSLYNFFFY